MVVLHQQALLLQVVTEVAGLRVVGAGVFVVELVGGGAAKCFERRHAFVANCLLQAAQPPVGVTVNVAVLLAALLVQRGEPFVEPRRAGGKIRRHKGVDDFVHQRPVSG